jgi:hypothetical protein
MDSQLITLWLCSFLPAPPQDHEPTISSTISLPICEPIFISPTSYRNSPMGPPPFISFPRNFCPPWGTHFTLGHPFLYLYIFPQLFIIYCTNAFIFGSLLFVITVGDLLSFWPHATHVTLGWSITSHLNCQHRLYLHSTTQVTYLYPLNLFTLSHLWHNLSLILSSP